ncbi:hypothetical protein PSN45_000539 [Yamadazyma tenuis]|uniref:Mannosyltransferase n=1 Tax=Candida tenuis (strain ATCC 10573 / BCRC 21748 / CBS 615 / JCM 9827 / NBRC 10315 / NRRL Y-1498 / VKM Y-70) TaxID=590646 RepID=G3B9A5_CANTC|nr:mannosyltransferase [Yamadazyma tenuis ATCC 10573]EGV61850.1 mannosyltransferase [Yamadazyma tenuis ATCC 10573]WEJ93079.1 hypothetical protein PSN45_000539 [Yamadazyma tenuis]
MSFEAFQLDKNTCEKYQGASVSNFVFSILITLGIFLSYVPQYHRIYAKRTSEGLSTKFLLLGSCSSIFTFTNIILISSTARSCCRAGALSTFNCINSQLNLVQIGLQCICAIMILVLVLVLTRDSIKQDKAEYRENAKVGKFVMAHFLASIVQIIVAFLSNDGVLVTIANLNGLMSTTLTVIKYVPQIYTTYRLKHPGTLSVGMMCIQTPGGALFTATLFFTKGSHWSSWISYFVAFILQGILLSMCLYFEYFRQGGLNADTLERLQVEQIMETNMREEENDAFDVGNVQSLAKMHTPASDEPTGDTSPLLG